VIGFPHGNTTPDVKYKEACEAIKSGAKELDVVINYGAFLDGNSFPVTSELSLICSVAHESGVLVKAILEVGPYKFMQIVEACRLCVACGVDFVKSSTGFYQFGGATPEIISTMLDAVKGTGVQVKASGGISSYEWAAPGSGLLTMRGCCRESTEK
jgi:deoxyribose-phosphate aldolase